MPADAVITRAGPVAIPLDYQLPTGTEIVPLVVTATLDGSAAAGPFLAVCEVIAPSGVVTARCCRQLEIAAGASVGVSWFPGVAEADQQASSGGVTSVASPSGTLTVTGGSGPTVDVDLPLTGVVAGSYGDASDAVQVTVDAEGRITTATSVPISGGGTVVASDGWVPDTTETWTFASFTAGPPAAGTFTVPGDLRAKYSIGTRIKLVQTTTKYFVVSAAPTYDGTKTTVTISGGTDYTLANAAISGNYHSYVSNPQGFPGSFAFNCNPTGWSSLTSNVTSFTVQGALCLVQLVLSGTSNATTVGWTAPIVTKFTALNGVIGVDGGTVQQFGSRCQVNQNTTTGAAFKDWLAGAWTSSGTKTVQGELIYPIA